MRRSFRTLRLCAIPGVSPRAGMRCPVGALRTPLLPRAPTASTTTHLFTDNYFSSWAPIKPPHRGTCPQSTKRQRARAGASIGTSSPYSPSRASAKAQPAPRSLRAQDRSRGAPIRQAERDRSEASIEGDHPNPSRTARKLLPPPSLPANAGPIPRSPPPPDRPGQSL